MNIPLDAWGFDVRCIQFVISALSSLSSPVPFPPLYVVLLPLSHSISLRALGWHLLVPRRHFLSSDRVISSVERSGHFLCEPSVATNIAMITVDKQDPSNDEQGRP